VSNVNAPSAPRASGIRGNRGVALLRTAVLAGALSGVTAIALADTAKTTDGPLTWNGITLYGTVDASVQWQSHGVPSSDYFPPGTEAIIQKNSNGSQTSVNGNSLSQSKIGVSGREEFGNGWAGVFKAETFFNPWSGHISDALKSVTANNGVALTSQNTGVDSSIAGQFFGGQAWLGVSNAQFGTLTFGRHLTPLADGIGKYDPLSASQAFSPIGWSGTAAGAGDTEDRRLDGSVKYDATFGSVHVGALFQPKSGSTPGTGQSFVFGLNFPGGSVDAFYEQKNDEFAAASLSAAQVANVGKVCSGTAVAEYACAAIDKAVAGTISDNTATGLMGKYAISKQWLLSAGYEQIKYKNPTNPVAPGQSIIGGYTMVFANNAAFPRTKTLSISWLGAKFSPTSHLDLIGAYYRYDQNSYAVGANSGCSSNVSGQCGGTENFVSFVADYHYTKRFDVYGGAMWSQVQDGLANGYILNTSTIDPTVGFRYSF
jgi:predicted porin